MELKDQLLQKISRKTAKIGVIGLGYVGLPLCHTFVSAEFSVLGFDVDVRKIAAFEAVHRGSDGYLPHAVATFKSLHASDKFEATSAMERLSEVNVAIICVPTPLGKNLQPDLSYVLGAGQAIANSLQKGQLVVLESTTYPGTTDDDLRRVLEGLSARDELPPVVESEEVAMTPVPHTPVEEESAKMSSVGAGNRRVNQDYFLAFSPEREDPGNKEHTMQSTPKLVGGVGKNSLEVAKALYESCFKVHPVSSTRVAESAKLVENIYRAVNIALVNELKIIFQAMDVDIWEVLAAAETKPFGFHRFNPGAGWGGHCIPVDPFYLTWRAKAVGMTSHFIERAGEINIQMPQYVVDRTQRALNKAKKPLNGSRVLLVGVAYKPNIADTRETPAFVIWELLQEEECQVFYHDPHVPVIEDPGHHQKLVGEKSVAFDTPTLKGFDAIIIVTHHTEPRLDFGQLEGYGGCVIDTRNCVPTDMGLNITKA